MDFALILLNVFLGYLLGMGVWCFPYVAVVFCIIFLDYLLSELSDKQRHLAGNFRGF